MSLEIGERYFDVRKGGVRFTSEPGRRVRIEPDDSDGCGATVPLDDLIEAVREMSWVKPNVANRTALVRDEQNHWLGNSYFLKECTVEPARRGRVEVCIPQIERGFRVTFKAKKLIAILESLPTKEGGERDG